MADQNPSFFQTQYGSSEGPATGSNATDEYTGLTKFEIWKSWYKDDVAHSRDWRQEARETYDFVAGQQWSQEDAAYLKLSLRPIITFNRIAPVVDSVGGLEINNRQQVCFFPRHVGDAGQDDLLTGAAQWIRDECDAEDEETDAFLDLITCGMGWTETRVSYDEDPEGKCLIERADPLCHYWDATSTKKNIGDARRIWFVKDYSVSVAEEMFPDKAIADLHAQWAEDTSALAQNPHDAQQAPFYRNDQSGLIDKNMTLVRLVELQWWEHEIVWRIADPFTQESSILSKEEYPVFLKRLKMLGLPMPAAVKQKRKCYWKAFLGNEVLSVTKGAAEGGFTRKCITGKRDRNKGLWYGLVRGMMDPQRWANKFFSQKLHILNTNAMGGIMAEPDAFLNPQEAEDNWSDPSAIAWLKRGAIAGQKIQPKPQPPNTQAQDSNLEFAIGSITASSGVNLEQLGQIDRNQPATLEHMRKQAAMTILAGFFASLRQYRKQQGRLLLYYITHFLSDGRLIRIGTPDEVKYVPLIRNPAVVKYDVIVDDTPTSVNIKEQAWGALTQMMPFLSKMNVPPQMWLEFIKYSPIPSSLVTKITEIAQQAQQQAQQQPHQDPKVMEAQAKVQAIQAQMQADQQQAQQDAQFRQQEIALQAKTDSDQMQMEEKARMQEMILEYQLKEREMALREKDTGHANAIDMSQHHHEKNRKDTETLLKILSHINQSKETKNG